MGAAAPPLAILACPTPPAWVERAVTRLPELLADHANCEKKAASSAVSLLFRYPQHDALTQCMSRLAREELRHYEQVTALMRAQGVGTRHVRPTRYAQGLRRELRRDEPGRLVDLLLAGAFIEARSCERFALLAPRLDGRLGTFYARLLHAEGRHYEQYLGLAERFGGAAVAGRAAELAAVEARLVSEPDTHFGFLSGLPAA